MDILPIALLCIDWMAVEGSGGSMTAIDAKEIVQKGDKS